MACTHVLHAFDTGFKTDKGKPLLKITGKNIEWIYQPISKENALSQKPQHIYVDKKITKFIEIPCGQCAQCRLNHAREWATRCMIEAKQYKENYFLTLTYDEEHLPKNKGIDLETGEATVVATLREKDLQDFMKRLRITWARKYGWNGIVMANKIRNFSCGEYGEKRGRPHYHAIIFNLPIKDLQPDHYNKTGKLIYYSAEIEKIWGNGIVGIGDVTWESACYVARYCMKKQTGPNAEDYYKEIGRVPEFVRMSRRPGIGKQYFEDNKDKIYKTDELFVITSKGVQKVKPSRYYDKLYDIENPERMAEIKEQRQMLAKMSLENQLRNTDLSKEEYLKNKEENKLMQIQQLKRSYEETGVI